MRGRKKGCPSDRRWMGPTKPRPNTVAIGAASEHAVVVELLRKGYEVFRGVHGGCSVDLIALKGGKLTRIEVRTGRAYLSKQSGTEYVSWPWGEGDVGRSDLLAVVLGSTVLWRTPNFPYQSVAVELS